MERYRTKKGGKNPLHQFKNELNFVDMNSQTRFKV